MGRKIAYFPNNIFFIINDNSMIYFPYIRTFRISCNKTDFAFNIL